jgi:hypothetical protein
MSTSVTHLPKLKIHDGLSHPFGLNILMSYLPEVMISFIIFRTSLPFINLGTRFLLRGEDYNTLCYENCNQVT